MPPGNLIIAVTGHRIEGLSTAYAAAQGLRAIIGSSGYLEIALKNDNAAKKLAAKVGDTISLETSNAP